MPAGDAQRVWFPEMLEDLRSSWSKGMTWEDLVAFCQRMAEKRKRTRLERGIQPPRTVSLPPGARCPKCGKIVGKTSRNDPLAVSIRSALFALKKSGAISEAEFKDLDKSWMKHNKTNSLDAYGQKTETLRLAGAGGTNRCHGGHGPPNA